MDAGVGARGWIQYGIYWIWGPCTRGAPRGGGSCRHGKGVHWVVLASASWSCSCPRYQVQRSTTLLVYSRKSNKSHSNHAQRCCRGYRKRCPACRFDHEAQQGPLLNTGHSTSANSLLSAPDPRTLSVSLYLLISPYISVSSVYLPSALDTDAVGLPAVRIPAAQVEGEAH